LNYQIYRCPGPGAGGVGAEEYREVMSDVCAFLDGRQEEVLKKLEISMNRAADELKFEKAAVIRDRIEKLKYMAEKQVALSTDGTDRDVISYSVGPADICIQLLLIRNGKLTGKEHVITGLMGHEAEGNEASSMADAGTEIISEVGIAEILISFIKQFYSGGIFIPDEVLVEKTDGISEELPVLSGWLTGLKGSKATVKMPARGEKLKLIKMAKKHAEISLRQFEEKSAAEELQIKDGLDFIRALPGMEGNVSRIEAYDISNTGISEVTASMVVFTDGTPDKKEYRKFRISLNKAGQDDYAAMRNVLQRRLKQREEGKKMRSGIPSVIFVDGGAGHVAAACDALNEAGSAVPVFGMVKDAKHRTRGIVAPGGKEFRLEGNPAALRFISAVQDEAHRFALKYNIKLREKRVVRSELDNIRGIGPKKKKALIRHFGSVAAVRKAGIDDLEAVEGISRKDAERIFSYFSLLSSLEK
ncbi:MAG: excinuclease ABC subunit UvrC, partial [Eubacteriales bacterium]|nr:excinuclease ABC subunit UvrC [Eubacteriales bacterium]